MESLPKGLKLNEQRKIISKNGENNLNSVCSFSNSEEEFKKERESSSVSSNPSDTKNQMIEILQAEARKYLPKHNVIKKAEIEKRFGVTLADVKRQ